MSALPEATWHMCQLLFVVDNLAWLRKPLICTRPIRPARGGVAMIGMHAFEPDQSSRMAPQALRHDAGTAPPVLMALIRPTDRSVPELMKKCSPSPSSRSFIFDSRILPRQLPRHRRWRARRPSVVLATGSVRRAGHEFGVRHAARSGRRAAAR